VTTTLEDLRRPGHPVLLVFTGAGCRPCAELLPELAQWQNTYNDRITIALVNSGSPDDTCAKAGEHKLRNMLMDDGYEIATSYQFVGTPSATVIDAAGRTASPMAAGGDAIRSLVWQMVGEATEVPLLPRRADTVLPARNGLGEGDQAPDFALADVTGRITTLHGLRGTKFIVLFWDPSCGFCQSMMSGLQSVMADKQAIAAPLLLITPRPLDDEAPIGTSVLIDATSATRQLYHAAGTPMALLVDQFGLIGSPLAAGEVQILNLLREVDEGVLQ
jgi:peroxiredoxin